MNCLKVCLLFFCLDTCTSCWKYCHVWCRNKGISFVAIDPNKSLSEQGPFNIILHKVGKIYLKIMSLLTCKYLFNRSFCQFLSFVPDSLFLYDVVWTICFCILQHNLTGCIFFPVVREGVACGYWGLSAPKYFSPFPCCTRTLQCCDFLIQNPCHCLKSLACTKAGNKVYDGNWLKNQIFWVPKSLFLSGIICRVLALLIMNDQIVEISPSRIQTSEDLHFTINLNKLMRRWWT